MCIFHFEMIYQVCLSSLPHRQGAFNAWRQIAAERGAGAGANEAYESDVNLDGDHLRHLLVASQLPQFDTRLLHASCQLAILGCVLPPGTRRGHVFLLLQPISLRLAERKLSQRVQTSAAMFRLCPPHIDGLGAQNRSGG